jgi:hypothetical protein
MRSVSLGAVQFSCSWDRDENIAKADRPTGQVLVHRFDLDACRDYRQSWGCFRDRRPDLYGALLSHDGSAASEACAK